VDQNIISSAANFGAVSWQSNSASRTTIHTNQLQEVVRRALDIALALLLFVLTLPILLLAALAIKLDSPGPVFYRQERVGLNDRVFTIYKLRSMRADAETGSPPVWAAERDPRVTRVGALIRHTRIDEIPQVANVLRGDMSLIGPRPERPHFVDQLREVLPFYADRHHVRPGITGWAQVNYSYGATIEDAREKLAYDLYYVNHRSLVFDLLVIISTVRVILFREGAR
jgi:exopolysaccharide biosynthesis polyprenyl glycosylphosphotransferase